MCKFKKSYLGLCVALAVSGNGFAADHGLESIYSKAGMGQTKEYEQAKESKDLMVVPNLPGETIKLQVLDQKQGQPYYKGEQLQFQATVGKSGYFSLWNVGPTGNVTTLHPPGPIQAGTSIPVKAAVSGDTGIEQVYAIYTNSLDKQPKTWSGTKDLSVVPEGVETALLSLETAESAMSFSASAKPNRVLPVGLPASLKPEGKLYVLAMGANVDKLVHTDKDAENFADYMKRRFNLNSDQVRLIPATYKKDFLGGLDWLTSVAGPDDVVMIMFSGHGSTAKDQDGDESDGLDEIFITMDVASQNYPDSRHVVSDDEFAEKVNGMRTKNVVAVFDACHSGGLHKSFSLDSKSKWFAKGELGQVPAGSHAKTLTRDLTPVADGGGDAKQVLYLAAAREDQTAQERPDIGGVFTYEFLNAMNRASNGDTLVTIYASAQEAVRTRTANQQTPVMTGESKVGERFHF